MHEGVNNLITHYPNNLTPIVGGGGGVMWQKSSPKSEFSLLVPSSTDYKQELGSPLSVKQIANLPSVC